MTGLIERLPGWPPVLPDLFAWVESGLPGSLATPGLHGIRIEESSKEGMYILRAELPGVDPVEGIELSISEGVLTLRAERGAETTAKHHTEFRYGTFARSVRLPMRRPGRRCDRGIHGRCPDRRGSSAGHEVGHQDHSGATRLSTRMWSACLCASRKGGVSRHALVRPQGCIQPDPYDAKLDGKVTTLPEQAPTSEGFGQAVRTLVPMVSAPQVRAPRGRGLRTRRRDSGRTHFHAASG